MKNLYLIDMLGAVLVGMLGVVLVGMLGAVEVPTHQVHCMKVVAEECPGVVYMKA